LSPWVRHGVKRRFAVRCDYCLDQFLQDAPRLVKRRQALRERDLPRNSQLENHRTDEAGGGRAKTAPAHFGYRLRAARGISFL